MHNSGLRHIWMQLPQLLPTHKMFTYRVLRPRRKWLPSRQLSSWGTRSPRCSIALIAASADGMHACLCARSSGMRQRVQLSRSTSRSSSQTESVCRVSRMSCKRHARGSWSTVRPPHPQPLSWPPPFTPPPTPPHGICVCSMAVHASFNIADPHLFIEEWTLHMRNLSYAAVGGGTILIQTDFSAQYAHKAAWTNTCEHPPTSNMDVFVVTRVVIDEIGARTSQPCPTTLYMYGPTLPDGMLTQFNPILAGTFITDVWRIFSAAKGSSAFHNKCLWQIVQFYRGVIELTVTLVFTDGCRGQYKGRRNFHCLSLFASQHTAATYEPGPVPMSCYTFQSSHAPSRGDLQLIVNSVLSGAGAGADATMTDAALARQPVETAALGKATPCFPTAPAQTPLPVHDVIVRHLFACGHHFKGPHDGYGKDAKLMPKTAEKHQKARIATTHDLYHFNATHLPCPRSNIKASDVIASLQKLSPPLLAPLHESSLPQDWATILKFNSPAAGTTCLTPSHAAPHPMPPHPMPPHPMPPHPMSPHPMPPHPMAGTTCLPCNTEPPLAPDVTPLPATDLSTAAAALNDDEVQGLEGLELDDLNARPTVSYQEEDPDSEPEDTSAGDFDFELDESGSRITRDEQLEDEGYSPSPAPSSAACVTLRPAKAAKLVRKSRVITTTHKSAGEEESAGGEVQVATSHPMPPHPMPPHPMSPHPIPCRPIPCHPILCRPIPCRLTPSHATPSNATPSVGCHSTS